MAHYRPNRALPTDLFKLLSLPSTSSPLVHSSPFSYMSALLLRASRRVPHSAEAPTKGTVATLPVAWPSPQFFCTAHQVGNPSVNASFLTAAQQCSLGVIKP
jgi:hypothetical protein